MNEKIKSLLNKEIKINNEFKEKIKQIPRKLYNVCFKEEISKENNIFIIAVLIIYIIIICMVSFCHEAWEDEAQAWLIARDLSPIQIINQMKYEGHSCMWHFILFPLAKLGLPFDSIKIVSITAAIITGYLILKKSPFNRITKVCILFSSTFLYYIPIIVRPYSLLPLLITIISIMNKDKEKYPIAYGVILAIMANIHIIVLPLAGMLFLYNYGIRFIYDRKKWNKEQKKKIYIGLSIAIAGMLIMFGQAVAGYFCSHVKNTNPNNIAGNLYVILIKFVFHIFGVRYMRKIPLIIIIGIISLGVHSIFVSNKHGAIFWATLISFAIVHIFIWNMVLNQRIAMIFLYIYYYAWNYRYDIDEINIKPKFEKSYILLTKLVTIIMVLTSILSVKNTYDIIKLEIEKPYCSGKDMAEYIKENISEDSVFISKVPSYFSTVIAYLDNDKYEFYEIMAKRNYTFKTWDETTPIVDKTPYSKAIEKYKGKEIYIIEKLENINILEEFLEDNVEIQKYAELVYKTEEKSYLGPMYLWKVVKK